MYVKLQDLRSIAEHYPYLAPVCDGLQHGALPRLVRKDEPGPPHLHIPAALPVRTSAGGKLWISSSVGSERRERLHYAWLEPTDSRSFWRLPARRIAQARGPRLLQEKRSRGFRKPLRHRALQQRWIGSQRQLREHHSNGARPDLRKRQYVDREDLRRRRRCKLSLQSGKTRHRTIRRPRELGRGGWPGRPIRDRPLLPYQY